MKKEFIAKIAAIQQELKAPKANYNEFNKFNYRSAEDILEALKPILSKYGLLILMNDEMVNIGDRYYCKATVSITDGEDIITTTAYAREDEDRAGMSQSQSTGCSSSYARKYALAGLLAISTEKDSDAYDNRRSGADDSKPQSNEEILTKFCHEKKSESGVDLKELKKFFAYYKEKCANWTNQLHPDKLWSKWIAPKKAV